MTGFDAAISSLLPLNAIPYDRVQASESHLINRYEREARLRLYGCRDKATTSRRRTSKVTFLSFLNRGEGRIIVDKTV